MRKKIKAVIAIILCITCMLQPVTALSATFSGKTYVKEVILSYGKTEEDAKSWLTNKGYKVLNHNLNEGADDTFSTKRAVYLGYKTTSKASEAITDMKVMNMKGGYSIEDYQLLLEQNKAEIKEFLNNFMVAVNEFRSNYKKGQQRAKAAYEMLNLMYDDDTEEYLGDLFLNKVKEEYTDDEFAALSKDEQNKVADMTTILMQANSVTVLAIEQIIAIATDDNDSMWIERYQDAKTYDEMVEDLMESDDLTMSQATKEIAAKYDSKAKIIASKLDDFKEYIEIYTKAGIDLSNSQEEIETYQKENENFSLSSWFTSGTQYEILKVLENDDVSLIDLLTSDDYDLENEDRYMLYPLVASLTEGQQACLDYLTMQQIVYMGINNDEATKEAMSTIDANTNSDYITSIYDGIDRSIFSDSVALTGDAYKLQNSTDKNAMDEWQDSISSLTKILYFALGASATATVAAWGVRNLSIVSDLKNSKQLMNIDTEMITEDVSDNFLESSDDSFEVIERTTEKPYNSTTVETRTLSKVFKVIGIATTCITIGLMVASLWSTYKDLQKYYNAEFTQIPMHMVNQGVDENEEKVFTYYTAVKCNREEAQMVTDNTKILDDFGDLNGDVGKQWVALYTTKDTAAGNPITADFKVQYNNTNIPDDRTALSIFCDSVAENLTNEKAGYTYSDSKEGIYLFYGTDSTVYAGSAFSNGQYALIGGASMIVFAVLSFFVGKGIKKRKEKNNAKEENANA